MDGEVEKTKYGLMIGLGGFGLCWVVLGWVGKGGRENRLVYVRDRCDREIFQQFL